MNVKVIYIAPIKFLNRNDVQEYVLSLIYSTLLVNAHLSDDIEIYTDLNGMSIFSILPYNLKLINSNNIDDFNTCVIKKQVGYYLLLKHNDYIKSKKKYFGVYYFITDGLKLNEMSLNTVSFDEINEYLKDCLGNTYNRLINRINSIVI